MADNRLSTFLPNSNRSVMGAKMLQRPAEPYLRQQAPEVYGALSGLMGTAPDQQGSVLDPNTARARAGAEIGFPIGTALQMMPFAKPAAAGVKALGPTAGRMAEGYLTQTGGILPLDVYHGTPHTFTPTARNPLGEFDASKIGTGEGAQSYGYGLYFAENPAVSESYRKMISIGKQLDPLSKQAQKFVKENMIGGADNDAILKAAAASKNQAARWDLEDVKRGIPASRNDYVSAMDEVQEFLRKNPIAPNDGSLYKVDLPDEQIAKMLDWDKPLSEQHLDVRAALMDHPAIAQNVAERAGIQQRLNKQYPDRLNHPVLGKMANREIVKDDITGREIYEALASHFDDKKAASQYLNEQGIPGIKYLDEGSRKPGVASMSQAQLDTRINILKKDIDSGLGDQDRMKQILSALEAERASHPKLTRNFVTFPGEEKSLTILERNGQPSQNSLNSFMR